VRNLGDAMETLAGMGFSLIGLAGEAETELEDAATEFSGGPVGLVLGAEGPGLRARTRELCTSLARIRAAGEFGSLNVSNAAAVSLALFRK
jgi:23S rRNA (guanosine2251-2'-O)-methyltransferase